MVIKQEEGKQEVKAPEAPRLLIVSKLPKTITRVANIDDEEVYLLTVEEAIQEIYEKINTIHKSLVG